MARSRSFHSELIPLFNSATVPIYAVDDQRRIVYCNPACTAWIGTTQDKIIGLRCDYHSNPEANADQPMVAGLCPPPEVFAGRSSRGVIACHNESAGCRRRRAEFLSLGGDALETVGIVAVLGNVDLPERASELGDKYSEPIALHEQIREYRQRGKRRYHAGQLIGESFAMKRVREQVTVASATRSRVVLWGPKGSGREHVARVIHHGNLCATESSLIPLDCALLDSELLQATVSALVRRWSELERDQPSALLLLDVDQLSSDAQRDLTGFVNIQEFELRTIATSRQSLMELAEEGKFRRDLAFALSTLVIQLPSLAERREDVPVLAQFMLEELNAAGKRQLGGFSPVAMDQLTMHDWPGNLDELASVVRWSHQHAEGPLIQPEELPDRLSWAADALAHPPHEEETIKLDEFLHTIESELLTRALRRSKGNKAQAARLLGISRARLLRRLSQLGLDVD